MYGPGRPGLADGVALLAEGVDRNLAYHDERRRPYPGRPPRGGRG